MDKEAMKKKMAMAKLRVAHWLPELPKGICVPGKMYQKDCRGCFCNAERKAVCVNHENACDEGFYPESADSIRPRYSTTDFENLPTLPHMASKCDPGKSYKVDCNSCVCLINHSLLCDMTMCLSFADIHTSVALRASNKNCTEGENIEPSQECIQCECTKSGVTSCTAVPGCVSTEVRRRNNDGGSEIRKPMLALTVDSNKKCVPGTIYRLHCNRCFCQEDQSLRCTQKTCLHYAQTLQLQKHRLYLQKHNL